MTGPHTPEGNVIANPIGAEDYGNKISAQTLEFIAPNNLALGLCDRSYQPDAANTAHVDIRVFRSLYEIDGKTKAGAALSGNEAVQNKTFATGATWPAGGTEGMTNLRLTVDQESSVSRFMEHIDVLQLPPGYDLMEQEGRVIRELMNSDLDTRLNNKMLEFAKFTSATDRKGSSTTFYDEEGNITKASSADPPGKTIADWIRTWGIYAGNTGFGISSRFGRKQLYIKMDMASWAVLSDWWLDKNLNSAGESNLNLLQQTFNDAAMGATQRVMYNVAIMVDPRQPIETVGGKKYHTFLAGTTDAFAFVNQAMDTRVLGLHENQSGDGTDAGKFKRGSKIDAVWIWGTLGLDDRLMRKFSYRAEA